MNKIRYTIVDGPDFQRVKENAELCWINGKSHVRSTDRVEKGPEDQLVGQLGEYALAKFLGDIDGYFERRDLMNLNPTVGDDGSDFGGLPIDVKTSLMRASLKPLSYNLLVRPRERHADNLYVLALVSQIQDTEAKVYLVGFAEDRELPFVPESFGPFKGAFKFEACRLHAVDELSERI